jgi:hypothetical protein
MRVGDRCPPSCLMPPSASPLASKHLAALQGFCCSQASSPGCSVEAWQLWAPRCRSPACPPRCRSTAPARISPSAQSSCWPPFFSRLPPTPARRVHTCAVQRAVGGGRRALHRAGRACHRQQRPGGGGRLHGVAFHHDHRFVCGFVGVHGWIRQGQTDGCPACRGCATAAGVGVGCRAC